MNENTVRQKQIPKSLIAGNHEKFPQTTESCSPLNLPTYKTWSGAAGHGQAGNNFSYSQQATALYFGYGTIISGGTFIFNSGARSCTSCPSHSQSSPWTLTSTNAKNVHGNSNNLSLAYEIPTSHKRKNPNKNTMWG